MYSPLEKSEHIACRLTAAMPAALATIGVYGPDAMGLVWSQIHCQRPIQADAKTPGRSLDCSSLARIRFAQWPLLDGSVAEDVVLCNVDAGSVEIHCHGGVAVGKAILDSLSSAGCRIVDWDEWSRTTRRHLKSLEQHGESSTEWKPQGALVTKPKGSIQQIEIAMAIRLAAERALMDATSDRAAAILLDQWSGGLWNAIQFLCQSLSSGELEEARKRLDELLQWKDLGRHLTKPWTVVLAGPPNVGKSSLINAMTGQSQSIVHHQAGTTRDWIEAPTQLDGWPVNLIDTAGLHNASDQVEYEGVRRAAERIAAADLVIIVVDATVGWTPEHDRLIEVCMAKENCGRFLCAWNKADLNEVPSNTDRIRQKISDRYPQQKFLAISCSAHSDVGELLKAIVTILLPELPPVGAAVPFTECQLTVLERLANDLKMTDSQIELDWLHELKEF